MRNEGKIMGTEELKVNPPYEDGTTLFNARWFIETPKGTVAAWNREALEYFLDELDICRNAIEGAYDFVVDTINLYDDDMTQGAGNANLRRLNEAVGKATPRLLFEREDGMTYYGLRWREMRDQLNEMRALLKEAYGNDFANGRISDVSHWQVQWMQRVKEILERNL